MNHAFHSHLMVQPAVLPFQKLLYGSSHLGGDSNVRRKKNQLPSNRSANGVNVSHPLAEADDGPQTEAQRTAAAEAATEEPAHIDWQRLPQAAVYTADTGFEFFWCHLKKGTFTLELMCRYKSS